MSCFKIVSIFLFFCIASSLALHLDDIKNLFRNWEKNITECYDKID